MNPNQSREETLAQLKAALAKGESDLALVPADAYVIQYCGLPLKTNGTRVGLTGLTIYWSNSSKFMQVECDRFNELLPAEDEPAIVITQPAALAIMILKNAELLASIPPM